MKAEIVLGTNELARFFEVTTRTVSNWRKAGCPSMGRGRWDLMEVHRWWLENIFASSDGPETGDLQTARTAYWTAKAERERMKADTERGSLIAVEDVVDSWVFRINEVASALEALRHRLPPLLMGKSRDDMAQIIGDEVWQLRDSFARDGINCETETNDPDKTKK